MRSVAVVGGGAAGGGTTTHVEPEKGHVLWSTIRSIAEPVETGKEVTITVEGVRYLELPDDGLGALVGWIAGPARLVRCVDRLDRHVTGIVTVRGHTEQLERRQRTVDEQFEIQRNVNDYLNSHGVPAQPDGFRWFIRLPNGTITRDDFWALLLDQFGPGRVSFEDEMLALRKGIQLLYE